MSAIRGKVALQIAAGFSLCVLVLLICFLSACGAADELGAEPSSAPSPTVLPSPTPTPPTEPKVELLGYKEYFAEEREIEQPFEEGKDVPFCAADDDWGKLIRRKDGYVVAEDVEHGSITVADSDGYLREAVFVKDNKLYITEDNGETAVVVYEAAERLRLFWGDCYPSDGLVVGFADGTKRYRLYVPTKTVDFMFDLPDIPYWDEWKDDTASDDGVFVDEEGLKTNLTWNSTIGGGEQWCRAYAASMGWDYESGEFDGKLSFEYNSATGMWSTWEGFDWAMDMVGVPEELREYRQSSAEEG